MIERKIRGSSNLDPLELLIFVQDLASDNESNN